jgi:chromosome segregation ATPase
MTTSEATIGECECGECGKVYDFEASGAECSDQCPECQAKEESRAREEEAREDAIAEAQDEVDEAEFELETLLNDFKEIRERIGEVRHTLKMARKRLAAQ